MTDTDTETEDENEDEEDNQPGRIGDPLEQLASVAIHGSSIRTEPGTDPDKIGDDDT